MKIRLLYQFLFCLSLFLLSIISTYWTGIGIGRAGAFGVQSTDAVDCATINEMPSSECLALVALYHSTDGPNWTENRDWLTTSMPCSWSGVRCDQNHVVQLHLSNSGLKGSLPSEISNLTWLNTLDLTHNGLTQLPIEIGNLVSLIQLHLSGNQLDALPFEIVNLTSLETVDVSRNRLREFPSEIKNLINLNHLNISNNELTSAHLDMSLTNLEVLDISNNQLREFPTKMVSSANLLKLDVSHNLFTDIPAEIGNSVNLTWIGLHNNQITNIPRILLTLEKLEEVHLYGNRIGGTIPSWLAYLPNLTWLDLGANQLTGNIPIELTQLTNLRILNLHRNQLSGLVPPELINLAHLEHLYIDYNRLRVDHDRLRDFLETRRGTQIQLGIGSTFDLPTSHWETTQTILPTNLQAKPHAEGHIQLLWEPIDYQVNGGYYEIEFTTSLDSPFAVRGRLSNRSSYSYYATGLEPNTTYFFRLRTYTPTHGTASEDSPFWQWQQNELWSEYSEVVSATTVGTGPIVTGTSIPNPTSTTTRIYTTAPKTTPTPTTIQSTAAPPTLQPTETPFSIPTYTTTHTPTNRPTIAATPTPPLLPTATNVIIETPVPTATESMTPSSSTPTPMPTPTPTQSVIVTPPSFPATRTWTLLIYAVGDNDLHSFLSDSNSEGMLSKLRVSGPETNVQVGILYDGPADGDTYRYILTEGGMWNPSEQPEAEMDKAETLQAFIEWGHDMLQSDYYALALLDHANGILGIGQDLTTDPTGQAFLEPKDIRSAILNATDTWDSSLDVLHIDGCSFGLFENASIVDELADYVVASPNTGWGIFAYDTYRSIAGQSLTPETYARGVAEHYADTLAALGYPYTISVFNMTHYDTVKDRVNDLGNALADHVEASPTAHRLALRDEIRNVVQKYDSGDYIIEMEDDFVDLGHLADELLNMEGTIAEAAEAVSLSLANFVEHRRSASGQFEDFSGEVISITLDQSQGIGIFYPYSQQTGGKALTDYTDGKLFPKLTQSWGWTQFLRTVLPPTGGSNLPAREKNLLSPLTYGLYSEVFLFERHVLYLPIIVQ